MHVINPFSVILVLLIVGLIGTAHTSKKMYLRMTVLTIIINAFFFQGYFIYIGNHERSYDMLINIVYLFIALLYLKSTKKRNVPFKNMCWGGLLLCSIIIGAAYFKMSPFSEPVVSEWDAYALGANVADSAQLYLGPIIYHIILFIDAILSIIIIKYNLQKNDYLYIAKWTVRILCIDLFYGIGEFFINNFINNQILYDINGWLLGVDQSTFTTAEERGNFEKIQGFTREPAHFVFSLLLFLNFIFIKRKCIQHEKFSRTDYITIVLTFAIMLVSGSFSSLIYIPSFLCVLAIYRINFFRRGYRLLIYTVLALLVSGGLFYIATIGLDPDSYLGSRVNASFVVLSYLSTGALRGIGGLSSALPRFMSIYETWQDFIERPLFGLGVGVEWCHSSWMTFLSFFGIAGLVCWLKALFSGYKYDTLLVIMIMIVPYVLVGVLDWIITLPMIFIVLMLRKDFVRSQASNMRKFVEGSL